MKSNAMKRSYLVFILLVLTFTACSASSSPPNSSPQSESAPVSVVASMDAGAIVEAFATRRNLPQVQGSGIVTKVLKDDTKGLQHQKFLLKVSENITILIAHNIDLAARVADIREGDSVEFNGEYIYTPKGGTVHWTHKDPRGNHVAGWLKHNGKTYE